MYLSHYNIIKEIDSYNGSDISVVESNLFYCDYYGGETLHYWLRRFKKVGKPFRYLMLEKKRSEVEKRRTRLRRLNIRHGRCAGKTQYNPKIPSCEDRLYVLLIGYGGQLKP